MRVIAAAIVLGLLLIGATEADEQAEEQASKPLTPEQAADAVLEAFEAKDEAALKALASKGQPGPWLVTDELCFRGEHDAAEAFARAVRRKNSQQLPAYVASQRGRPANTKARDARASAVAAQRRGDFASAVAAVDEIADAPLDVATLYARFTKGYSLRKLAKLEESTRWFEILGERALKIGWIKLGAVCFTEAGLDALDIGDYSRGIRLWTMSLELSEKYSDAARVAGDLINLGIAYEEADRLEEALEHHERGLRAAQEAGHALWICAGLFNVAKLNKRLGRLTLALEHYERCLEVQERHGFGDSVARTLSSIGLIHLQRRECSKAMEYAQRSLEIRRKLGDRVGEAISVGTIARIHFQRGEYARALRGLEWELQVREELGHKAFMPPILMTLGHVYLFMGDEDAALEYYERCAAMARSMGRRLLAAEALWSTGSALLELGRAKRALRYFEEALAMYGEGASPLRPMGLVGNIGAAHVLLGNPSEGEPFLEEVIREGRASGVQEGVGSALHTLAEAHLHGGRLDEALKAADEALDVAEASGDVDLQLHALATRARIHLGAGRWRQAASAARTAVERMSTVVRGHAEEEGAKAREHWAQVFDHGVRSGMALMDAATACYFLESGRAGSLRESLSAGRALREVLIPEKLRRAEIDVREQEQRALTAYWKAGSGGSRGEIRRRRKALEAAREKTQRVVASMQREAKAGADVAYPKAASLNAIRGWLREGEALLLLGSAGEEIVALIVRADGARMVALGPSERIVADATHLLDLGQRPGARGVVVADDTPAVDLTATLASLSQQLVDPLGLGEDVKRVLVSPTGALGYVPFALLLPDHEVIYVPSGTTYGLLTEEREKHGEKVLALGDPDYGVPFDAGAVAVVRGGRGLQPLPGTREEVRAVGDRVLIGRKATEEGLSRAVKDRERWRAVHLACHGLIDAERPMFSSLALTPGEGSDGFLTCLEVFRLKIPADLVVLSACETAKGQVYRAEGIVGLTRAFMYAGAPRVLCSLWKVDDEATQALMIKFYDLWNPKEGKGLGAAAALKKAQEFVRRHEKWKHPYYWAAWVLWGLPE